MIGGYVGRAHDGTRKHLGRIEIVDGLFLGRLAPAIAAFRVLHET